jgi:hypothetical protein
MARHAVAGVASPALLQLLPAIGHHIEEAKNFAVEEVHIRRKGARRSVRPVTVPGFILMRRRVADERAASSARNAWPVIIPALPPLGRFWPLRQQNLGSRTRHVSGNSAIPSKIAHNLA